MSSRPPNPPNPPNPPKSSKSSRSAKSRKSSRSPSASKSAKRPGRAEAREFSAGGVVVRDEQVIVIVPTRRAADGSRVLALPKGHVDPGETPVQAATREVREETGVVAEPVHELGESRYWYRRDGRTIGKAVVFFLFDYVEGDTADHDDEVEEVRWIGLEQARTALSHAAEREMVELAIAYLRKDR
ncbi:MAG: hydrolase [Acidimicrobiaceae bacterium]|nr:hydrolase [Acidimicrobiaceae bacterium]